MIPIRPRDIAEHLDSDEAIAAFLAAVFKEGDAGEIRDALNPIARAKGMRGMAKHALRGKCCVGRWGRIGI